MGRPKKVVAASTLVTKIAPPGMLIPSGVTLLDLACTDTLDGFCTAGHGVNIIGDRDVGKTALALAAQAETCNRHGGVFSYDFYDAENAFTFNVERLWGKKFAAALKVTPIPESKKWAIEGLALKIVESMKDGKPRFVIIDSMDRLRPASEYDEETAAAIAGGKSGFATARSKANKFFFRTVLPRIAETGSFLVYLSQATCNMGFGAQFQPKTRGGGTSLGYNAHIELWLSQGPSINVSKVKVGHWVIAKTARSKENGKKREIWFPILPAYGVDDTRANIAWLTEEKVISLVKPEKDDAGDDDVHADDDEEVQKKRRPPKVFDLTPLGIEYIGKDPYLFVEENGLTGKIVDAVRSKWDANEQGYIDKTFAGRKPRYE